MTTTAAPAHDGHLERVNPSPCDPKTDSGSAGSGAPKRLRISRHTVWSGPAAVCAAAITALAAWAGISGATAADVRGGLENDTVRLETELGQPAILRGDKGRIFLRINLEGLTVPQTENRTPVNVGLVIDRSGSMADGKLERAKEAATMALGRLGGEDYAAVVAYDHNVDVVIPARRVEGQRGLANAIRALQPGGRTALYAGVEQGLREVRKFLSTRRVNRVILLSDGLANVGPATPGEMSALAREAARQGVSITTIGLGLGYNEDLMAKLAYTSDGNHAFVENADQLVEIFNREFGDARSIVAQDIIIEIEIAPGFTPLRTLGRDGEISGQRVQLRLNQVHAAQAKYALIELEPGTSATAQTGVRPLASIDVRYRRLSDDTVERMRTDVSIEVTAQKAEVERRLNKSVMADATAQKATLISERAVALRDAGDIQAASALLQENAADLSAAAKVYSSPLLDGLSSSMASDAEAMAAPSADWNRTRKAIRARQHGLKTQQTY